MKIRFAPSPTGLMHYGNVRTALFNYLLSVHDGGEFLLRIEDTDQERSKEEFVDALKEDMSWLGMSWVDTPRQSQRKEIYDEYYNKLEDKGLAYPCFCSQEQLAISRKAQLSAGKPPRYSGTCRNLSASEREKKLSQGLKPTLRFHVDDDAKIDFEDLIKGKQHFLGSEIGDLIIRRADGSAAFMFSNAIDDALMGVTHALRGEDHLTNTPRQILILRSLGLPEPSYGHFPLIVGQDSAPLSKRNGSETIVSLRNDGFFPVAICNYLARLGHSQFPNELLSVKQLADLFSLKNISKSPARHDRDHLLHWQKEAMLSCDVQELSSLIKPFASNVPEDKLTDFTALVQPNIVFPNEAGEYSDSIFGNKEDISEDNLSVLKAAGADYFQLAIDNSDKSYKDLIGILKESLGIKGKALFMPFRLALTGQKHGPELDKVFDIIGPEAARKRFQYVVSKIS